MVSAQFFWQFLTFFLVDRDFNELVQGDGATLDRPKFTVENAFDIGPVDVKMSADGTKIATSSVDNSLRIFGIEGEATPQLICEATAEEA